MRLENVGVFMSSHVLSNGRTRKIGKLKLGKGKLALSFFSFSFIPFKNTIQAVIKYTVRGKLSNIYLLPQLIPAIKSLKLTLFQSTT